MSVVMEYLLCKKRGVRDACQKCIFLNVYNTYLFGTNLLDKLRGIDDDLAFHRDRRRHHVLGV